MSGGNACKCEESKKPVAKRNWEVLQYKSNRSAFNGYREQRSDYSCLVCNSCHRMWRTKADYVTAVKVAQDEKSKRTSVPENEKQGG